MLKKVLLLLAVLLFGLNSFALESLGPNHQLLPKYFGHVTYEKDRRQVGLVLNPIEGEKEAYYGVLMEYLSPFQEEGFIGDFFRAGKKKLFSKKKNGYLEELLQWVQVFKIKQKSGNTYQLYRFSVKEGKFEINETPETGELVLKKNLKNGKLDFTVADMKLSVKFDSQKRFPLKSSWDIKYTPGPYNPGYKQADIRILNLASDMNPETHDATASFDVKKLKGKELVIKGDFTIHEPNKGIFTFRNDKNADETLGADLITDKIGAFIDIYDAKPVMNTVELILIDPANPYGHQMYFEEFGNKVEVEKP